MTSEDFARNLAKYFMNAPNKERALNHILIEIDCLQYVESKQCLQFDTKAAIVQLIEIHVAKDVRCLNAFQLLKPTLLLKLQENRKNKLKEDKVRPVGSYLKQFKWIDLLNYRS
jgi:hypothetical protein